MSPGDVLLLVHPSTGRLVWPRRLPRWIRSRSLPRPTPGWTPLPPPGTSSRSVSAAPCARSWSRAGSESSCAGWRCMAADTGVRSGPRPTGSYCSRPPAGPTPTPQRKHIITKFMAYSELAGKWLALYYVETSYCNLCGNLNGNNYTRYCLLQVRLQRPPG